MAEPRPSSAEATHQRPFAPGPLVDVLSWIRASTTVRARRRGGGAPTPVKERLRPCGALSAASALVRAGAPGGRPVLDTREHDGASASASGGGAPRE